MADYIIAFDAYGQPYLAHAWGKQKDHKYVHKEPDYYGPGKHLYLYSQKEYERWLSNGKKRNVFQRIQDRSRDKRGWDERSDYETAREKSEAASTKHRKAIHNMQTNMPSVNEANRKEAANDEVWKSLREYNDAKEVYEKTRLGQKELRKKRAKECLEKRKKELLSTIRKQKAESPYLSDWERFSRKSKRQIKRFLNSNSIHDWLDKNIYKPAKQSINAEKENVKRTVEKNIVEPIDKKVTEIAAKKPTGHSGTFDVIEQPTGVSGKFGNNENAENLSKPSKHSSGSKSKDSITTSEEELRSEALSAYYDWKNAELRFGDTSKEAKEAKKIYEKKREDLKEYENK